MVEPRGEFRLSGSRFGFVTRQVGIAYMHEEKPARILRVLEVALDLMRPVPTQKAQGFGRKVLFISALTAFKEGRDILHGRPWALLLQVEVINPGGSKFQQLG